MASDRRSDKQESDGNNQLGVEVIFQEPEMDKSSPEHTHHAKRRALRSSVCASIHIRKANQSESRDGTENGACTD